VETTYGIAKGYSSSHDFLYYDFLYIEWYMVVVGWLEGSDTQRHAVIQRQLTINTPQDQLADMATGKLVAHFRDVSIQ